MPTAVNRRTLQPVPQTPDHSLVRPIRHDGEVKAGVRTGVFEVPVRRTAILSPRGGAKKLSGEHAAVTEAEVQSFIPFVLGDHVEFVADVPACSGMSGNRNRSTAGVVVVIRGGQPEAFKLLFEFPFFRGLFFDAGSELHQVPAADQIVKAVLVMIRRIDLVKSIPRVAGRIFRSRGVIALEKHVRRSGNLAARLAYAGIARPRGNGRRSQRSCLSVELGVVIESGGEVAPPLQANGGFLSGPPVQPLPDVR